MKEFAYQFLFVAEGLNISDAEPKDIFNTSLNKHVPAWEMGMLGILSFWQFVGYVYHRGEEVGLPPLGPPPIPRTDYLVPSPPMTHNRRRRKNGPAVAPPDAADDAAAARPVEANDAAASPEAAQDAALSPEAVIPPSRSCRLRRKASSVPHGLEAIQELDVG